MTSRLVSAPPTDEDAEIWLSIVCRYMEDWATVGVIFRDADRGDADLMFYYSAMSLPAPFSMALSRHPAVFWLMSRKGWDAPA